MPFNDQMAAVWVSGKAGFIDTKGEIIIPIKFDGATSFSEGLAAVKVNSKWGYIDKKGSWKVNPQYDSALFFSEGLAGVKADGKWGYIDINGKTVIPLQYTRVGRFRFGITSAEGVYPNSQLKYFITKKNQVVGYANYDWQVSENDELLSWKKPESRSDNMPPPVVEFYKADGRLQLFRSGDKVGLKSEILGEVLPAKYSRINTIGYNHFLIENNQKQGIFIMGKGIVLPVIHDLIVRLDTSYFSVSKGDKKGVYKIDKGVVLPTSFHDIEYLGNDLFSVCEQHDNPLSNPRYSLYNSQAKKLSDKSYVVILPFKDGLAKVTSPELKSGLINFTGDEVVPAIYSELLIDAMADSDAESFVFPKLIAVKEGSKYGYVDQKGSVVVPFDIYNVRRGQPFGRVIINEESKQALFDATEGRQLTPYAYSEIQPMLSHFTKRFRVKTIDNGKYGIIDDKGAIVVPAIYDYIEPSYDYGRVVYSDGGKWGALNFDGEIIVKAQFDQKFAFNGLASVDVAINNKPIKINLNGIVE